MNKKIKVNNINNNNVHNITNNGKFLSSLCETPADQVKKTKKNSLI